MIVLVNLLGEERKREGEGIGEGEYERMILMFGVQIYGRMGLLLIGIEKLQEEEVGGYNQGCSFDMIRVREVCEIYK